MKRMPAITAILLCGLTLLFCGAAYAPQESILLAAGQQIAKRVSVAPTFVNERRGSSTKSTTVTAGGTYDLSLPDGTLANNLIGVFVTYASSPATTITVTDDQSNTWTNAFTSAAQSSKLTAMFYKCGAATNTRKIHVGTSATVANVAVSVFQFYGIATSSCLDTQNSTTGSSTTLTAGSITPPTSGDLLVHCTQRTGTPTATSFTPGSQSNITWKLMTEDYLDGLVCEYGVYSSTSAITPTMTTAPTTGFAGGVAAFKAANSGTAPTGMYIAHIDSNNFDTFATSQKFGQSVVGNLLVTTYVSGGNLNATGVSDDNSSKWYRAGGTISNDSNAEQFYSPNIAADDNIQLTVTGLNPQAGTGHATVIFYDVVGADADPYDTYGATYGNSAGTGGVNIATVTPSVGSGLAIMNMGVAVDTVSTCSGTGQLGDVTVYTGQSISGPSPTDENNGWCHLYTSGTSSQTFQITAIDNGSFQQWAGMAAVYRAPGQAFSGNWRRPRVQSASTGAATSITSPIVHTAAGDLAIVACYLGNTASATPISDSNSNTWSTVTNLNPYNDSTDGVRIYVRYSILTTGGLSNTFTCNASASTTITMNLLVVTPSGTPTLNGSGGTGRTASSATYIAASKSVTTGDLVYGGLGVSDGAADPIRATAGTIYVTGDSQPDGGAYQASGSEWGIATSTASLTTNFTTVSAESAGNVILSFSP
jgi:hypothetical protein